MFDHNHEKEYSDINYRKYERKMFIVFICATAIVVCYKVATLIFFFLKSMENILKNGTSVTPSVEDYFEDIIGNILLLFVTTMTFSVTYY